MPIRQAPSIVTMVAYWIRTPSDDLSPPLCTKFATVQPFGAKHFIIKVIYFFYIFFLFWVKKTFLTPCIRNLTYPILGRYNLTTCMLSSSSSPSSCLKGRRGSDFDRWFLRGWSCWVFEASLSPKRRRMYLQLTLAILRTVNYPLRFISSPALCLPPSLSLKDISLQGSLW